jgi:superfamily II DNA or RNA helicase
MEKLPGGVAAGVVVHARDDRWRVAHVQPFTSCALVTIEGHGERNRGTRTTLITPFDRLAMPPPFAERRRSRRATARAMAAAVARAQPGLGLWSAVDAAFDVHAWQLAPALAVVGGAARVLLADAVGLGKTIQAGLVLAELWRRGVLTRALVLTPASLRSGWAAELRQRFRLDVLVMDQPAMLAQQRTGGAGLNPWMSVPIVISSLDLVKRAEVRAAVEDQPLDVLVVDEAHHASPGSDRGAVVARLAARVPWLVLASATPHAGDRHAFRALLDLGRTSSTEAPMAVFRRSHQDAHLTTSRATHVLRVMPTLAEQRLLHALVEYGRTLRSGPPVHTGVPLLASVLARRATSSAIASARTLQRRLNALSNISPAVASQAPLPWEELDGDDATDGIAAQWLASPGPLGAADECGQLRALIAFAHEAAATPSKFLRLARLLTRLGEPAIVFSEFRDTIEACRRHVEAVATVAVLHGGLDATERGRLLGSFLDGQATVLLATDVAGEGLNLQHRARVVITLEWPWSPQRLEQRIGRVDRMGQTRRVHAFHLTAHGTFEETVVARLLEKRAQAHDDLDGVDDAAEPAIERRVFGESDVPGGDGFSAQRVATPGQPAIERCRPDARDEASRLLTARKLLALASDASAPTVWCYPTHVGATRCLAVVVDVTSRSGEGRCEWSGAVALRVKLSASSWNKRSWARLCRAVARDPRVHDAATRAALATASPADWAPVIHRLQAIRHARAHHPGPGVQPSLFDRRAIRMAEARDAVLIRLHDYAARQSRLLSSAGADGRLETRVVALLPLGGEAMS